MIGTKYIQIPKITKIQNNTKQSKTIQNRQNRPKSHGPHDLQPPIMSQHVPWIHLQPSITGRPQSRSRGYLPSVWQGNHLTADAEGLREALRWVTSLRPGRVRAAALGLECSSKNHQKSFFGKKIHIKLNYQQLCIHLIFSVPYQLRRNSLFAIPLTASLLCSM